METTTSTLVAAIESSTANPERRAVLRAAGLTGVACVAGVCLAACSSSSSPSPSAAGGTSAPADAATTDSGAGSATTAAGAGGSGTLLGTTSQVPVGGGMIFADAKVVVTQPAAGTFKAFSSTCTHQGCQVNQVTGGLIECPCHGSHYSITDGSVKAGPAPAPLPAKQITVQGDQIFLAA